MTYALKNTALDVILSHPHLGPICMKTKEEAEEMLSLCHSYVSSLDMNINDFVIIEFDRETYEFAR